MSRSKVGEDSKPGLLEKGLKIKHGIAQSMGDHSLVVVFYVAVLLGSRKAKHQWCSFETKVSSPKFSTCHLWHHWDAMDHMEPCEEMFAIAKEAALEPRASVAATRAINLFSTRWSGAEKE